MIFPYTIFVPSFLLVSPREFIWQNLMGKYGTETHFTIDVPSGQSMLEVSICCGKGDADLWVRYGEAPDHATGYADCRPFLNGNNERCILGAKSGTWHIMVYAYKKYSGVKLTAGYDNEAGAFCMVMMICIVDCVRAKVELYISVYTMIPPLF